MASTILARSASDTGSPDRSPTQRMVATPTASTTRPERRRISPHRIAPVARNSAWPSGPTYRLVSRSTSSIRSTSRVAPASATGAVGHVIDLDAGLAVEDRLLDRAPDAVRRRVGGEGEDFPARVGGVHRGHPPPELAESVASEEILDELFPSLEPLATEGHVDRVAPGRPREVGRLFGRPRPRPEDRGSRRNHGQEAHDVDHHAEPVPHRDDGPRCRTRLRDVVLGLA